MEISNYSIFISASFTCFLSCVLYFYKEYNFKDNKHIIFAILTITSILVIDKLEELSIRNIIGNILLNFFQGLRLAFIFPVFIHFFILHILNKSKKQKNLLLLPFLCFSIFCIVYKIHNDDFIKLTRNNYNHLYWIEYISLFAFSSYLFYKQNVILKKERTIKSLKIDKNWLIQITIISYLLILLLISFNFYKLLFDFKIIWFSNSIKLLSSLYFFWICFRGISELRIKEERHEITQKLKTNSIEPSKKRAHNILKNDKVYESEYLKEIDHLLKSNKLYREPDLSRERIAEKLGISPGYLSEIVNSQYNQNFSSLINSYRVKEAIELLQNPEFSKYSIVSIAYEVGFNSKSAFYKAFKKETGTTPTVYLSTKICPNL